jgi:hypothetical protein
MARVRDFVDSRVVGGKQQIKTSITFHTYAELVLWPYGYTYTDIPGDMTQDDHAVFVAMGQAMAATNGYTAQQASDLYITDGTYDDWAYGVHRIFAYTSRCTRPLPAGLLPARLGDPSRDQPQRCRCALHHPASRLPVPDDRQGGSLLQHTASGGSNQSDGDDYLKQSDQPELG